MPSLQKSFPFLIITIKNYLYYIRYSNGPHFIMYNKSMKRCFYNIYYSSYILYKSIYPPTWEYLGEDPLETSYKYLLNL